MSIKEKQELLLREIIQKGYDHNKFEDLYSHTSIESWNFDDLFDAIRKFQNDESDYMKIIKCHKINQSEVQSIQIQGFEKAQKGFFQTQILFKIQTNPQGWIVKRKFEDFINLRTSLRGFILPEIPQIKKQATDFTYVKQMHFLQLFLDYIVNHPEILCQPIVENFLQNEQAPPVQNNPICTPTGDYVVRMNNEIESQINFKGEYFQYIPTHKKAYKLIKQFIQQQQQIRVTMKQLSEIYSTIFFQTKPYFPKLRDQSLVLSNLFEQWGKIQEDQIKIFNDTLYPGQRFMYHQLQSLQKGINFRNQQNDLFQELEKKLLQKKDKLFQQGDISKWDMDYNILDSYKIDDVRTNKQVAFKAILSQQTRQIDIVRDQFAFLNLKIYQLLNERIELQRLQQMVVSYIVGRLFEQYLMNNKRMSTFTTQFSPNMRYVSSPQPRLGGTRLSQVLTDSLTTKNYESERDMSSSLRFLQLKDCQEAIKQQVIDLRSNLNSRMNSEQGHSVVKDNVTLTKLLQRMDQKYQKKKSECEILQKKLDDGLQNDILQMLQPISPNANKLLSGKASDKAKYGVLKDLEELVQGYQQQLQVLTQLAQQVNVTQITSAAQIIKRIKEDSLKEVALLIQKFHNIYPQSVEQIQLILQSNQQQKENDAQKIQKLQQNISKIEQTNKDVNLKNKNLFQALRLQEQQMTILKQQNLQMTNQIAQMNTTIIQRDQSDTDRVDKKDEFPILQEQLFKKQQELECKNIEIMKLQDQVQELDERIQLTQFNLQEEITQLKIKLQQANEDNFTSIMSQQKLISDTKQKDIEIDNIIQEHSNQIKDYQHKLQENELKLKKVNSQYQQIQQTQGQLIKDNEQLKHQLQEISSKQNQRTSEIDDLLHERKNLLQTIQDLGRKEQDLIKNHQQQVEQQMMEINIDRQQLMEERAVFEKQIQEKNKRESELSKQHQLIIDQYEQDIAHNQEVIQHLQSQVEQNKNQYVLQLNQEKDQIYALKQKLNDLEQNDKSKQQQSDLDQVINQLNNKIQQLENQISDQNNIIEDQQKRLSEISKAQDKSQLQAQHFRLQQEHYDLQQSSKYQIEQLQHDLGIVQQQKQQMMEKYNHQNQDLQKQNRQLQQKLDQIQINQEDIQRTYESQEQELRNQFKYNAEKYQREHNRIEQEKLNLLEQVNQLQEEIDNIQQQDQTLQKQIIQFQKSQGKADSILIEKENQIIQLQSEIQQLKLQHEKEMLQASKEFIQSQQINKENYDQINQLQNKINYKDQDLEKIKEQIANLQHNNKVLTEKLNEQILQNEIQQSQINLQEDQIKLQVEQLDKILLQHKEQIQNGQKERQQLKESQFKLLDQVSLLEQQNQQLQEQIDEQKHDIQRNTDKYKIESQRAENRYKEKLKMLESQHEQDVVTLQDQIKAQDDELRELKKQIKSTNSLRSSQTDHDQVQQLKDQIDNLTQKLNDKSFKIEQLNLELQQKEEELENITKKNQFAEQYLKAIQRDFQKYKDESQEENKQLQDSLHSKDNQISDLENKIINLQFQIASLEKKIEIEHQQQEQLSPQFGQLSIQLKDSTTKLGQTQTQINSLNKQIQQLQTENQRLKDQIDQGKQTKNIFLMKFEEQIQNQKVEINELKSKLEAALQEVRVKEYDLSIANQINSQLKIQIQQEKDQIGNLKSSIMLLEQQSPQKQDAQDQVVEITYEQIQKQDQKLLDASFQIQLLNKQIRNLENNIQELQQQLLGQQPQSMHILNNLDTDYINEQPQQMEMNQEFQAEFDQSPQQSRNLNQIIEDDNKRLAQVNEELQSKIQQLEQEQREALQLLLIKDNELFQLQGDLERSRSYSIEKTKNSARMEESQAESLRQMVAQIYDLQEKISQIQGIFNVNGDLVQFLKLYKQSNDDQQQAQNQKIIFYKCLQSLFDEYIRNKPASYFAQNIDSVDKNDQLQLQAYVSDIQTQKSKMRIKTELPNIQEVKEDELNLTENFQNEIHDPSFIDDLSFIKQEHSIHKDDTPKLQMSLSQISQENQSIKMKLDNVSDENNRLMTKIQQLVERLAAKENEINKLNDLARDYKHKFQSAQKTAVDPQAQHAKAHLKDLLKKMLINCGPKTQNYALGEELLNALFLFLDFTEKDKEDLLEQIAIKPADKKKGLITILFKK